MAPEKFRVSHQKHTLEQDQVSFVRWAGTLNVRPSFRFYSRQLAIRWSSAGFPELSTRHMLSKVRTNRMCSWRFEICLPGEL
jgi:hypothetical protein